MSGEDLYFVKWPVVSVKLVIIGSSWQGMNNMYADEQVNNVICIHVIELLCYNWRFPNFWLEIWSHNIFYRRIWCVFLLFIDVFLFVCFSIEPTASHFNIYCLHFCLSSVSYDEWRIKTVFIIYS